MEYGGGEAIDSGRRPAEVRCYWGGLARLLEWKDCVDQRGRLVAFDFMHMPFEPRRSFVVQGVPEGMVRGGHAHAHGHQLLICLAGTILVDMRHGGDVQHVELCVPTLGLLVTAGIWAQQRYSGPEAVLLVMASHPYDPDSYLVIPS